jgi:hypothetical protein
VHQFSYDVQVRFGDKGDNLTFKSIANGQEAGSANIKFDRWYCGTFRLCAMCSICIMYYSKIKENVKRWKYISNHVYSWIALVTSLLSPCDLPDSPFVVFKQYINITQTFKIQEIFSQVWLSFPTLGQSWTPAHAEISKELPLHVSWFRWNQQAKQQHVGNCPQPRPTAPVNLPKGACKSLVIRAAGHSLESDMRNDTEGWPSDHHSFV